MTFFNHREQPEEIPTEKHKVFSASSVNNDSITMYYFTQRRKGNSTQRRKEEQPWRLCSLCILCVKLIDAFKVSFSNNCQ